MDIDHNNNVDAFCPLNHKNNAIYMYGENKNINNIKQEEVLEKIKNFYEQRT